MITHKNFKDVYNLTGIQINGLNVPVLLTGPAGTGKSVIVQQIANKLKLPFSYIAGSSQTSESKILGYTDANGNRVETLFTEAYVNGGVFCFEEMDAIPSGVLVSINSAIASDQASFGGKMFKRHKDFYMFATTNTYKGVNEQYSGRNKLDDSTLERYYKVEVTLDIEMEKQIMTKEDFDMIQYFRTVTEEFTFISTRQALMFLGLKNKVNLHRALAMTFYRNHSVELEIDYDKFKIATKPIYTKEEYEKLTNPPLN
jgi:MoxR-like ATPase